MNRMLRVNGTDERIVYAPRVAPKVDQVINVIVESFDHYFFFFMFRGSLRPNGFVLPTFFRISDTTALLQVPASRCTAGHRRVPGI